MKFTPKNSSHVEFADYDPSKESVTVKFRASKKLYTHVGVPSHVFGGLKEAASAGEFYHRFIKGYKRA